MIVESLEITHIDELVDEVMEVKPWRGVCYSILSPFRRFPFFFYIMLPSISAQVPTFFTLIVGVSAFVLDVKFAGRFSKDSTENLRKYIYALVTKQIIKSWLEENATSRQMRWLNVLPILLSAAWVMIAALTIIFNEIGTSLFHNNSEITQVIFIALVGLPFVFLCFAYYLVHTYFFPFHAFPNIQEMHHLDNGTKFNPDFVDTGTGHLMVGQSRTALVILVIPVCILLLSAFRFFISRDMYADLIFPLMFVTVFMFWTIFFNIAVTASASWKGISIISYCERKITS